MTGGEILILGKLVLTFGVLLGLPLWELHRLRRKGAGPEGRGTADRNGANAAFGPAAGPGAGPGVRRTAWATLPTGPTGRNLPHHRADPPGTP